MLHWYLVHWLLVVAWLLRWLLRMRCCIRIFLVPFFAFPTLHLCLFKKSLFFGRTLTLQSIFSFILPDQSLWWFVKDALIFAELADPNVFFFRWVFVIVNFLARAAIASCERVLFVKRTAGLLRLLRGLLIYTSLMSRTLVCLACYIRTRLSSLSCDASAVLRLMDSCCI